MNNNSNLKTIAAAILSCLLFFSMYYMHSIKTSLTQESASYFVELLDKTAKLIKIKADANFQILRTIVPEASKLDKLSLNDRLYFLNSKLENSPFKKLAYADNTGMALLSSGENSDILTTNFFQTSFYKRENCIENEQGNIVFSIPIFNSNKIVTGVLYAIVPSVEFFEDSTNTLLGINNNVNSYVLNNTTLNMHFLTKELDNSFFEKVKHNHIEKIIPIFSNTNIRLTEFSSDHQKYIFANTSIQSPENNLNWSLITILPSSVLAGAATQTIALISLLLFLLLLIFIGTIAYILNMQTQNKHNLEKIAYIDSLCSIYNNNGLIFYGEKKIRLWQINIAVIYLDIDNFKMINNVFGYDYGDQLLKTFSLILKKCFKSHSISARLSMDHFAIIVHYSNKIAFFKTLNKFIATMKNNYAHKHLLKLSLGLYFPVDHTTETISNMLNKANIARQKVKNKDRLPYFIYNSKLEQDLYYKTWLLAELKAALKNKTLELFYQPQYDLKNFKLNAAEAILVWNHPEKGFIPQSVFFKIAADNQLRTDLTSIMLEKICIDMHSCKLQNLPLQKITLNLSKFDFYQENLVANFTETIGKYKLDFCLFEIAIEETILVNNYTKIEPHLLKLRDLGISIAIDNFGTGYSSFSTLGTLAVDVIKIDHSIVINSIDKSKQVNIIKAIVALAKNINLKTVATGISTQEQLDILVELQCDAAQGLLFSKPLALVDYFKLLAYIKED